MQPRTSRSWCSVTRSPSCVDATPAPLVGRPPPVGPPPLDLPATTTRPPTHPTADPRADTPDGPREPHLGLPTHPRRTHRTRPPHRRLHRLDGPQRRRHRPRSAPVPHGDNS